MKTLKKGGDVLGFGAYGCVFNIEFPCRSKKVNKSKNGKYISKIFWHKDALKEAKLEFEISKRIYKIKGHKKWCVIWEKICKPHNYKVLYKYDNTIKRCLKKNNITYEQFNKRAAMLIGKYGGNTLENIFDIKMAVIKNRNDFIRFFVRVMKRMLSLFEGIKSLNKTGITHSDIKRGNIVLDGRSFKLIDFGLTYELNDSDVYKKRSITQYIDDRIYTPYPIDFVYTHTKKHQELSDREDYLKNITKRNFDEYLYIHQTIFKRDNIVNKIIDFLKDVKVDKDNIINTLDVYSLGYLIPRALYGLNISYLTKENIIQYLQDPIIKPFITLFKYMTRETFFNEGPRISSEEAYKRFSELVRNVNY